MLLTHHQQQNDTPQPKIKRASRHVNPHFLPIRKMGFPDGLRCWCGAELTFHYAEKGRKKKTDEFLEEHEECQPAKKEEEEV